MCTLTIKRQEKDVLVTMNRDEKKDRALERPPYRWQSTDIYAPQDGKGLGTWAAINRKGQIACLLNGYQSNDTEYDIQNSRGEIIPEVLSADDPNAKAQDLQADKYASFNLFVVDGDQLNHYSWDGNNFALTQVNDQEWFFFTSSSWSQKEVKATRQCAYQDWLKEGASVRNYLPDIHLYKAPHSSAHSISMERQDACTKSITQFDSSETGSILRYWPDPLGNPRKFEQLSVI